MTALLPFPDLNLTLNSQYSGVETSAGVTETTEQPLAPMNEVSTIPPPLLASSSGHISNGLRLDFNPIVDVTVVNQNFILPPPGFGINLALANAFTIRPPPIVQRPPELAGVTILGEEQQRHHREILKRTRMLYESLRLHLMNSYAGSNNHFKAWKMIKESGLSLNKDKRVFGSVPGVEVGDVFLYQIDLCVVGLHNLPQAGIDFITQSPIGVPIATSVILSESYEDDEDNGDVVVYTGQGGQSDSGNQIQDQKLERGNLGMVWSMLYGVEIRVIRAVKHQNHNGKKYKLYVFDGLYRIVEFSYGLGKSSYCVFKFKLVRVHGQPMLGSARIKLAQDRIRDPLKDISLETFFWKDISNKEEKVPVYLSNNLDGDLEPVLKYKYIPKSVFPYEVFVQGVNNKATGCDCIDLCLEDCLCARKNGGEFAYDKNGHLLRGKHVIFECGAACKCGPSCKSRVTQKGLRYRLEVFRSEETNWGVKTMELIEAGAFICEYAGNILSGHQAEIMSMNGDKMVYPCWFTKKWISWGDLTFVIPDYERADYPTLPPLDFQIDVSEKRNVASYISHSKEPNVMVQYVLYDHDNLRYPHVMLFAMETISPSAELTLDYGFPMNRCGSLPSLDAVA